MLVFVYTRYMLSWSDKLRESVERQAHKQLHEIPVDVPFPVSASSATKWIQEQGTDL